MEKHINKYLKTALLATTIASLLIVPVSAKKGFTHGIIINVDDIDYYMDGAPDGPNGEWDIPGHY